MTPEEPRSYRSLEDFRNALERRLQRRAGGDEKALANLRRLVGFDRLLARLFLGDVRSPWLLKGGCSLGFRYDLRSRVTRDIDLTVEPGEKIPELSRLLTEAAARDPNDGFQVVMGDPQTGGGVDAAPEGGARFAVGVRIGGRRFVEFHVDVGIGDAVIGPPEEVTGEPLLEFAGIPPARALAIPLAQHFAEKIHAYSMPRPGRNNTRVKDLVDLALILERGAPPPERIREALRATFGQRGEEIPCELAPPPAAWTPLYPPLAEEAQIGDRTAAEAFDRLSRFWKDLGA